MQWCIFQERNLANAFLISFDAEATSFFTEQHVELRPGLSEHKYLIMSVWEHDYLQYSWIAFPHCPIVTAVSRVLVDKFLVMGSINKGWYGMFVACGIWCLADVSSVSPSSEQTHIFSVLAHAEKQFFSKLVFGNFWTLTSSNNSSTEFQHCNCVTEYWYGIATIECCCK